MIKNYFKIAFRNIQKQKFYALINILGLAVGIASCLLILLFVIDELSYDKHHEHSDRIYRVAGDIKFGGNHFELATGPAPLAETLIKDYPEIEASCRFRGRGGALVKRTGSDAENVREPNMVWADHEVFDVFTIPLISGDANVVLTEPATMVISESMGKKYFENENPIGEVMTFNDETDWKIVGVFEDMPTNGHFNFDFMLSMESLDESKNPIWLSNNFNTYFVLQEGKDPKELEAKFPDMLLKYMGPQVQQFLNISMEEFEASGDQGVKFYLQPLTDIHLKSDLTAELGVNSDIAYVYIFAAIALFLLIIACINFMNLSTARSANRAREVGVRKVLGSFRSQLIGQFLVESVVMSVIAFSLALIFAEAALPVFNRLSGKELSIPYGQLSFMPIILIISILIGVIAGLYPAFFLSAFKPVQVLKGKLLQNNKGGFVRSSLVVFQFTTSIVLIIGTLVVYQQMSYIKNKNLGFNKDQVILLHNAYALGNQLETFKNEMLAYPEVQSVSTSSYLPVTSSRSDNAFWPEGNRTEESSVSMQNWVADYDYLETMGLEIIHGRAFSKDFPTDSTGIILNETALKNFGWEGEDPIGKRVSTYAGSPSPNSQPEILSFTVVGVVKDFHFESLKQNITSWSLILGGSSSYMAIRTNTEDVEVIRKNMENKWKDMAVGQPFDYSFLDERFERMYQNEQRRGEIFGVFAVLAIFIACLGLFALSAFVAEQRTREIGIRKVLGANTQQIMLLLSKDFSKLVLIAFPIATGIGIYAMNSWLQDFAYRIELKPWVFILAGVSALLIALLTVSFQSIRAAVANPIEALKEE